jgi:hypothetical protein
VSNGRSIGLIAGSIVALVVVAIVIVLLADRRQPQQFAAGSPEATVQAYLQAWDREDLGAAYVQFSSSAQRRMAFDDYEAAARYWDSNHGNDIREAVFIDRAAIDGARATVYLIVETSYGSNLELNTYRNEREISLEREAGAWRIADALVFVELARDYNVLK